MLAQLKEHGNDPLTPVVVQRGLKQDQINYLLRARPRVPRRADAGQLPAQLPVPVARRPGARLRRPDLARGVQAAEAQGLPADRLDRPGRRRVDLRHLPARQGREGAADRRLARPPEGRSPARGRADARAGAAADDRHQAAARRRAGAQVRRRPRPHEAGPKGRTPTAARSSRSSPKDGAVLAMASYPTYQPSIYVGRKDPKKLAPLLDPVAAEKANHPGINRAIDAAYPPGLDVQAGDGARRDAGGADEAVRRPPVHARLHRLQAGLQELDAADRPGHGPADRARRVVRHVLLRARPALLQPARRPRPPAAGVGEPLRPRRVERHRRAARGRRPDADARVAAPALPDEPGLHARSTARGSRATRSSSRSARGRCS